jgi:hypothetical protein
MVRIQWFQSTLLDYDLNDDLNRSERNQIWSFLYQKTFANETWKLEVLTMYGIDQHDSSVQIELSHMFESNVKLWLGADLFSGNKQSLFGQFSDTDRLVVGFEWGF